MDMKFIMCRMSWTLGTTTNQNSLFCLTLNTVEDNWIQNNENSENIFQVYSKIKLALSPGPLNYFKIV